MKKSESGFSEYRDYACFLANGFAAALFSARCTARAGEMLRRETGKGGEKNAGAALSENSVAGG